MTEANSNVPERPLRHPIILACGIARFDAPREHFGALLKLAGITLPDSQHYFKGVRSHLEKLGFEVHHTRVSFAADVKTRAQELADHVNHILEQSQATKAHLISHSMGGLDARHMIVDLPGMAEKVASLTTVGTPHFGSPMADYLIKHGIGEWVDTLSRFINLDGVHDLATDACRDFNQRAEPIEAANKVTYQTWSSAAEQACFILGKSAAIITKSEGPNDGLVSLTSQRWQSRLGGSKSIVRHEFPYPTDHLNQLGWWLPADLEPALTSLSIWKKWKAEYEACGKRALKVYEQMATNLQSIERDITATTTPWS